MARWFLSYNSKDRPLAERLYGALRERDSKSDIFFAPSTLQAGGLWLADHVEALNSAEIFVLLIGPNGIGRWQAPEYFEAIQKLIDDRQDRASSPEISIAAERFKIVVVLLDGVSAPGLPYLRLLHWIVTPDPGSQDCLAQLMSASVNAPKRVWRYLAPYRGLAAMTEADTAFFFGRSLLTTNVITHLAQNSNSLTILLGNSGVGKSSVVQAGVLSALRRKVWPDGASRAWPAELEQSNRWAYLIFRPGEHPLRSLAQVFLETWQLDATHEANESRRNGWIDGLRHNTSTLSGLLDATEKRLQELGRPVPLGFVIYIDQGEELWIYGSKPPSNDKNALAQKDKTSDAQRFSEIILSALSDRRLRAVMTLRSDFLGWLQNDILFDVSHRIDVPPLRKAQLLEVVERPAELLSAHFELEDLPSHITTLASRESTGDAGSLPLLSYLLDDMWTAMIERDDGLLKLPSASLKIGDILAVRADRFLAENSDLKELTRKVMLQLATIREDGVPVRRRAALSEFNELEVKVIHALASQPYRLLAVTTPDTGESCAEVAHEIIFKWWSTLADWIADEREFLVWRTRLELLSQDDLYISGDALKQAHTWLAIKQDSISQALKTFISESEFRDHDIIAKNRRIRWLAAILAITMSAGLFAWYEQQRIKETWTWYFVMSPFRSAHFDGHALSATTEQTIADLKAFKECDTGCPEMIIIPKGSFLMGAPEGELGRTPRDAGPREEKEFDSQGRQHQVTIGYRFAVSEYLITFDDWDACVKSKGCEDVPDSRFGRGRRPVINVTLDEAKQYTQWLSQMTRRSYRLLSEAEWEYAARGRSPTAYWWGDNIGTNNANCHDCNPNWIKETSLTNSFKPNPFGLYDMSGNVWEWVEDCRHETYDGAPSDGSAWTSSDCKAWIVRGGSWLDNSDQARSASRASNSAGYRDYITGFRIARSLDH